jgi:hypothetical protein
MVESEEKEKEGTYIGGQNVKEPRLPRVLSAAAAY